MGPTLGSLCRDRDLAGVFVAYTMSGASPLKRQRFEPLSDWCQFGSPFPTPIIDPGPETVNSNQVVGGENQTAVLIESLDAQHGNVFTISVNVSRSAPRPIG